MQLRFSFLKFSLLFAILVFAVACSTGTPVLVPKTEVQNVDLKTVEEAILKSTREAGWKPDVVKSGVIKATLTQRKHMAAIQIEYSSKSYTIKYSDSQNLEYDKKNNTIHRNYNRWVNNLDRRITKNLYNLSSDPHRVIISPFIVVD
jgi:hypothetical protein